VKDAGVTELQRGPLPSSSSSAAAPIPSASSGVRAAFAAFWLRALFFCAQHLPWLLRAGRGFFVRGTVGVSASIRRATAANGRRILGPGADPAALRRYARGVVGSFFDFVCDIGRADRLSRRDLVNRIEHIEGTDRYLQTRQARSGAIIVTAHMGSFEVGVAALLERERRIHVVFKRDTGRFERIRQALRLRLGVVEQPVDDGWGVWVRLRDALRNDEVVAIQGDRVMPAQKGRPMPVLGGHLVLPTGPVKLAMASGAPIIPVFSVRTPRGGIRLFIEEPILVENDVDEPLTRLAAVIEKYVSAYPEQWLVLHPAFEEDDREAPAHGS
jgi:KDO2-lipid IV(A) lauroyltransferase